MHDSACARPTTGCTVNAYNYPSPWSHAGYPFDIPPRGSALTTYCTLVYHIPLLIAFSIKQVRSRAIAKTCSCKLRQKKGCKQPHQLQQQDVVV